MVEETLVEKPYFSDFSYFLLKSTSDAYVYCLLFASLFAETLPWTIDLMHVSKDALARLMQL